VFWKGLEYVKKWVSKKSVTYQVATHFRLKSNTFFGWANFFSPRNRYRFSRL